MTFKPYDIQWPVTPQRIEDINANFDAIWRALAIVEASAGSGGVSSHNLLSAVHLDTTPGIVIRGDLIYGAGATPSWARLAKGTAADVLTMGANEPAWAAIPTQTSLLLSATHTDTTPAAAVRGDLIVAQGVSPLWARLPKGTSGYALIMGANEPAWTVIPTQTSALLSAVHTDTSPAAVVRGDLLSGQGISATWSRLAKGLEYDTLQMGAAEPQWNTNPRMATLGLGVAAESGANAAVLKMAGTYYGVPVDDGNSSAAKTIDWATGNEHKLTLTSAVCTLTFSNPKTGGRYVLELVQDATGGRAVVWPGTVIWNNGIPPSLTAVAGGIDLIAFYYDGTNYIGAGSGVGGGTVTSVGLTLPAEFSVSGSPVLASGTISATWVTVSPNLLFAGPSGGAAAVPTFRTLVLADLPSGLALLANVNTFTAAGTHTWSASLAGGNILSIRNTLNDSTAYSQLLLGNDAVAALFVCSALSSSWTPVGTDFASGCVFKSLGAGGLSIGATDAAGVIRFYAGGTTEWMRVHSDGQVMVRCTAQLGSAPAGVSVKTNQSTTWGFAVQPTSDVAGGAFMVFLNAAGNTQGQIQATNSTTTAYATSSDERMKRDLGLATDVKVLRNTQIHEFEWIENKVKARGVFAQEAVLVLPEAIVIGKDDLKDGKLRQPWGVDYSKYVPDLIVGWQHHEARIAALEKG